MINDFLKTFAIVNVIVIVNVMFCTLLWMLWNDNK